jgi:hypothetical protein
MICTEEEARKKWCPMAHTRMMVILEPGMVDDPDARAVAERSNCVATDCMMWVWADHEHDTLRVFDGDDLPAEEEWDQCASGWSAGRGSYTEWKRDTGVNRRGGCGLAGSVA